MNEMLSKMDEKDKISIAKYMKQEEILKINDSNYSFD